MALDELKENDERINGEGFTVVVDKELLEQMGGVLVDYRESPFGGGFIVRPKGENFSSSCSC